MARQPPIIPRALLVVCSVLTLGHLSPQVPVGCKEPKMEGPSYPSLAPALQSLCISQDHTALFDDGSSSTVCNMDGVRQSIATLSQLTSEIKVYLPRTYSAVCNTANKIDELALEDKYIHAQLSCLESRMEDMDRNIIELMGKVDSIKEDISAFSYKTQCSFVQEAPTVNQEMVDAASVQQQNFR